MAWVAQAIAASGNTAAAIAATTTSESAGARQEDEMNGLENSAAHIDVDDPMDGGQGSRWT